MQGVAHVVETQGVREFGIDQTDHMAPGQEGATFSLHGMRAGQLRHQMVGNKITELPEERELSPRWLALRLLFHTNLVAGFKPASQLFSTAQSPTP